MGTTIKKTAAQAAALLKTPAGIGILIILFGGIVFVSLQNGNGGGEDFAVVSRQNLVREVNVTGTVKPADDIELAFQQSGRIASVNAETGDAVGRGKILVSLQNSDLRADLAQAEANLDVQEITLANIKKTSSVDLENAANELIGEMRDSFAGADSAVRNDADQLFTNSANPTYESSIYSVDIDDAILLNLERKNVERSLDKWRDLNASLSLENDLRDEAALVETYLIAIQSFLNELGRVVNDFPNDAKLNTHKTTVAGARTSVNSALSSFRAAKQDYLTAEAALSDGGAFDDVLIQEANVKGARARVDAILADIEKTVVRSPISGVVTKLGAEVGELATANEPVVTVISEGAFEIEADIPELQIPNIQVGDEVSATLDAYGPDVVFGAVVTEIDPAATIVGGVPNYKTTIVFTDEDERIRAGMTANVSVVRERKENVLAVPRGATVEEDGRTFVERFVNDSSRKIERVPVTIGITGSNGFVEIESGLEEGDRVAIQEI